METNTTMRKFQVLDSSGNPIKINELDLEVCQIQNKKQDPKWYCGFADPNDYEEGCQDAAWISAEMTSNWFDTIGRMIADQQKSFQDIIDYYASVMEEFIGQPDETGKIITLEDCYPYRITLLKNWIKKGYIAKSLN